MARGPRAPRRADARSTRTRSRARTRSAAALRDLALANTLGEPLGRSREREIDETLARFPLAVRLVDGRARARARGGGVRGGLATVVAVVAEARLRGVWERMKACRQETCGWLFYDGSRNRSSSWCSMQICGGREKARAIAGARGAASALPAMPSRSLVR